MKLTFVCLGNIGRSPMAEFIFKNLLASSDLENVRVDSAATSYEEVGNPIYPPARSALTAHAVPYDASKRARRLTKSDYASTDLFVCMEERNRRDCLRIFGGDPEGKVVRLLDFTKLKCDVADPYYTGDFETTYRLILTGCEGLIAELKGGEIRK